MSKPLRLVLQGASGRMGRALLALLNDDHRFELIAAMVGPDSAVSAQPIGPAAEALRFGSDWSVLPSFDVIVDFSGPAGFDTALRGARQAGAALVTGTTGLSAQSLAQLEQLAADVPVFYAANFSLGVAILGRLLAQAAKALPDWDLEIVEAHHRRKQDAPSGTALALGQQAAAARGGSLQQDAVFTREGAVGPRRDGEIGFAVVRGGSIVGEHQAWLIGPAERIELSHRADDRSIFARGALEAALWVANQPKGRYGMEQLVASRAG